MADAHTGALQQDHLLMDELKVLKNVDKTIKPLKLTNLTMTQFPKKIQGEQQGWTSWYDRWTPDQWREWLKDTKDDDDESDDELRWDELEMEEIEVLPDELLGWLLLRRANLPAAAHLSVQASVQNSLKYRDIETALRDQEEEVLHGDHQRQQAHRHRRTFWVEEQGAWGLLALPDDQQEEAVQDVHWVGDTLPSEVYHPNDKTLIEEDDDSIYWTWEMDGYHGYVQDSYGQWMETDGYGNYWASETDDFEGLTTDQMKELEEAYSAYEKGENIPTEPSTSKSQRTITWLLPA